MSAVTPAAQPESRFYNPSVRVLGFAAIIALLYFGRVFLITVVIAGIIAFLLEPAVSLGMKLKLPRAVASFLVCTIALLGLYLIGLGLYTEGLALVEDLPTYSERINALVDSAVTRMDQLEKNTYELVVPKRLREQEMQAAPAAQGNARQRGRRRLDLPVPPQIQTVRLQPDPKPLYTYVYGYVRSFYEVALMASFVPFLVYFMLSWSDHLRRSSQYLFSGQERLVAGKSWDGVAAIARGYVIGNFVLGILLSVISSVFFFSIRLPYWPLIGPLSGFLSLVPYVGLPLAIAPALLAGLVVYTQPGIYVMIAIVVGILHILALNLLYPKIVGARVHLNPLAVTIALMFWGTLWGGIGLLLAIPLTAGLKTVCDNVSSLQGYGKLLGD